MGFSKGGLFRDPQDICIIYIYVSLYIYMYTDYMRIRGVPVKDHIRDFQKLPHGAS